MYIKQPPPQIDEQFRNQSEWTKPLREYILKQLNIPTNANILEIGCGTGVVLDDFYQHGYTNLVGLDINPDYLHFAKHNKVVMHLVNGDAFRLPFSNAVFDVCFFHYFLIWVSPLNLILKEALRVMKQNGVVIALAEPDYKARIDFPDELQKIGEIQNLALAQSGADLAMGRKLKALFATSGLKNIKGGIFGQEWSTELPLEEFNFEWNYLEIDLFPYLNQSDIDQLKRLDYQARQENQRLLYIPTFWAIGWT
ncbi:MAG: class I SAM-dependent methyltransferase [Anaerolineales bacterium]